MSWIFATVGLAVGDPETAQAAAFPVLAPLVFASSAFVPVDLDAGVAAGVRRTTSRCRSRRTPCAPSRSAGPRRTTSCRRSPGISVCWSCSRSSRCGSTARRSEPPVSRFVGAEPGCGILGSRGDPRRRAARGRSRRSRRRRGAVGARSRPADDPFGHRPEHRGPGRLRGRQLRHEHPDRPGLRRRFVRLRADHPDHPAGVRRGRGDAVRHGHGGRAACRDRRRARVTRAAHARSSGSPSGSPPS